MDVQDLTPTTRYRGVPRKTGRQTPTAFVLVCVAVSIVGLFGGTAVYNALGDSGAIVADYARSQILGGGPPPFEGNPRVNILVLGVDKRENDGGRFDTMMVVSVNARTQEMRMISIPRDTRIAIPGTGRHDRINTTMPLGGVDMAIQAVEKLLHVPIDYYAVTDIEGFGAVVDRLGGVDIDVEKRMRYTDRRGGLYIDLQPGLQRLDGDKALQYVRFRHDAEGDIARVRRQQKFLRAVAKEMGRASNVIATPAAMGDLCRSIDTDLDSSDFIWLARTAKNTADAKIRCVTVPTISEDIDGVSYQITDERKLQPIIEYVFYSADESILGPPSIEIFNATGAQGVALEAAQQLREQGYDIASCKNWPGGEAASSSVVDNRGWPTAAQSLAKTLNLQTVSTSADDTKRADITVILGKDYVARKG